MLERLRILAMKARTALRLGVANIARVGIHRARIKAGMLETESPVAPDPNSAQRLCTGPAPSSPPAGYDPAWRAGLEAEADAIVAGSLRAFGQDGVVVGSPPDWFSNVWTGGTAPAHGHWTQVSDFTSGAGDIKTVWEWSRCEWLLVLARAWRVTGKDAYRETAATWLADWMVRNPPHRGTNWKCAQEASIRLLHMLRAFEMFETAAKADIADLIVAHLSRIEPTLRYAMAQDNNHIISEAAALFVGGEWLLSQGPGPWRRLALTWAEQGRWLLERCARHLILDDGTFAQYSLVYHRLMLDTLCQAEVWRRHVQAPPFSDMVYGRAASATEWLGALVSPVSGDAPNLGSNDGAYVYRLTSLGAREFRPSVQTAAVLFQAAAPYAPGPWDEPLCWLGLTRPMTAPRPARALFADGGLAVLRPKPEDPRAPMAVLRFPRYRFRPHHADALHLDFWVNGDNVLRDDGTGSYNPAPGEGPALGDAKTHNTIAFDDGVQMPRISRFLLGGWMDSVTAPTVFALHDRVRFWAACTTWRGARHRRSLDATPDRWIVTDEIGGFRARAILRWRLQPGTWTTTENGVEGKGLRLTVSTSGAVNRLALVESTESRRYQERTPLPVLEVEVGPDTGRLETVIQILDV